MSPTDCVLMKFLWWVETQIMNNLPVSCPRGVHICLYDRLVFPQKLKVNLILSFVTFQRWQIKTAIQATCVSSRCADLCTEGSWIKAICCPPPCPIPGVICDCNFFVCCSVLKNMMAIVNLYMEKMLCCRSQCCCCCGWFLLLTTLSLLLIIIVMLWRWTLSSSLCRCVQTTMSTKPYLHTDTSTEVRTNFWNLQSMALFKVKGPWLLLCSS